MYSECESSAKGKSCHLGKQQLLLDRYHCSVKSLPSCSCSPAQKQYKRQWEGLTEPCRSEQGRIGTLRGTLQIHLTWSIVGAMKGTR